MLDYNFNQPTLTPEQLHLEIFQFIASAFAFARSNTDMLSAHMLWQLHNKHTQLTTLSAEDLVTLILEDLGSGELLPEILQTYYQIPVHAQLDYVENVPDYLSGLIKQSLQKLLILETLFYWKLENISREDLKATINGLWRIVYLRGDYKRLSNT